MCKFSQYLRVKGGFLEYDDENYDDEERSLMILWLFVNPSRRNQGVATQLLHRLFKMAAISKAVIYPGIFTPEGHKYLKPVIQRLKKEYKVKVVFETRLRGYALI